MKIIILFLSLVFFDTQIIAQNSDCYERLLQRGIEEFDKANFNQAILKWQTAKDDCPDVTASEKQMLDNWIKKANNKQKSISKNTLKTPENIKIITKSDTVIKIVKKIDTVYIDKPVEKIVYVDRPVEKIVYVDKPEPYHQFGKGNGKITLFKVCNCYNLKFWVDGEYIGTTTSIFTSGYGPECGNINAVSEIVLSGKHHIIGKDNENHSWDFYVTVYEDQCLIKGVSLQ